MNGTTADLPAGPGEALHILEPGGAGWWTLLAVLLVPLLMGLVMQWLKGLPAREVPAPRAPMAPPPVPRDDLGHAIDTLRDETLADADYRAGCHRLGALMRDHVSKRRQPGLAAWTVREIVQRLGDTPYSTVLALLADLQFRRDEPDQDEFLDICQLARDTASGNPGSPVGAVSNRETVG